MSRHFFAKPLERKEIDGGKKVLWMIGIVGGYSIAISNYVLLLLPPLWSIGYRMRIASWRGRLVCLGVEEEDVVDATCVSPNKFVY